MSEPTAVDLARMAAFIDGEGSIRVNIQLKNAANDGLHYPTYTVVLAIDNTDFRLMTWLVNLFGGNVETKVKKYPRRTIYRWRSSADQRKPILESCMPFFVLKKRQAELAIEMIGTIGPKRKLRTPAKVAEQDGIARSLNILNLTRGKNKQERLPMVQ